MRFKLVACAVGALVAVAGLSSKADASVSASFTAFCSVFNNYNGYTQGSAGANNCGNQVKTGSADNGDRAGQAFNYPTGRGDAEGMYSGNDDVGDIRTITGNSSLVELSKVNNPTSGSDVTTYGTLSVNVSQSSSNSLLPRWPASAVATSMLQSKSSTIGRYSFPAQSRVQVHFLGSQA